MSPDAARQKERQNIARAQRRLDFRAVLQTPQGKRFLYAVLDQTCGVFGGSFVLGGVEAARQSDFNEGRRSVGIDLLTEAQEFAPEDYRAMVSERIADVNAEAATRKAEAGTAVPAAGDSSTS